jgi:hypothetical protein
MKSVGLIVIAVMLALSAPASATGTVRIQQRDGSVQTYTGVTLKAANKSLTLISADKVSTVVAQANAQAQRSQEHEQLSARVRGVSRVERLHG